MAYGIASPPCAFPRLTRSNVHRCGCRIWHGSPSRCWIRRCSPSDCRWPRSSACRRLPHLASSSLPRPPRRLRQRILFVLTHRAGQVPIHVPDSEPPPYVPIAYIAASDCTGTSCPGQHHLAVARTCQPWRPPRNTTRHCWPHIYFIRYALERSIQKIRPYEIFIGLHINWTIR
jgi:hypothetical protein